MFEVFIVRYAFLSNTFSLSEMICYLKVWKCHCLQSVTYTSESTGNRWYVKLFRHIADSECYPQWSVSQLTLNKQSAKDHISFAQQNKDLTVCSPRIFLFLILFLLSIVTCGEYLSNVKPWTTS